MKPMRVLGKGMPELLQLPFSPWSEKARWALDRSGIAYRSREYLPLLGELALRRLLKRWRGPVTVPVLIDGARVLGDSFEIARYAAERDPTLIPAGKEARVAHYHALSQRALAAGRAIVLQRMLAHPEALAEVVPPAFQRWQRVATALGDFGIRRTLRKYALQSDLVECERIVLEALDTLRRDLAAAPDTSEPRTLLGSFSYADIAMAQVLVMGGPPALGLRMGEASRRVWTDPVLSERYADLVSWRDALYARYRKPELVRASA